MAELATFSLKTLVEGDGVNFPRAGCQLKVHYTGKLASNGKIFDTSRPVKDATGTRQRKKKGRKKGPPKVRSTTGGKPFEFVIGSHPAAVIRGWEDGLLQMSLGERAELYVPAASAYGERGYGLAIPPHADLVFNVELLAIESPKPACLRCSKPSNMVCPKCRALELPDSYFCSKECFKAAWKVHKQLHKQPSAAPRSLEPPTAPGAAEQPTEAEVMSGAGNERMDDATDLGYTFGDAALERLRRNHRDARASMVHIEQHTDGVASAVREGAGAWNFKLWPAARVMAKFIETKISPEVLEAATVLELGAGTGLTSVVAGVLGARHVISTDLPCAMPLLRRNLEHNFGAPEDPAKTIESATQRTATCGSGHALVHAAADCDEYMCEACGAEIDEGANKLSCRACDFDVCSACGEAAQSGHWDQLPGWYALALEAAAATADLGDAAGGGAPVRRWVLPSVHGDRSQARSALLMPFDFLDEAAVARTLESAPAMPSLIVVADCTFTREVCDGLVARLLELRAASRAAGVPQRLLLVHEDRTAAITTHLLGALRGSGIDLRAVKTAGLSVHRAEQVMMFEAELGAARALEDTFSAEKSEDV
jgi:FK506-binding protein 1